MIPARLFLVTAASLALPGCASLLGVEDVEVVTSIAELRAGPPGSADVILERAAVTYVRAEAPARFYLQSERTGPAIEVFNGPDPLPEQVVAGAVLELHVTETGVFRGNEQISRFEILDVDPRRFDVTNLQQDLAATSQEPSEELEAELIRLSSATVEVGLGPGLYEVSYGSSRGQLFLPAIMPALPVGCVFRLNRGVVTVFDDVHQLLASEEGDFSPISSCAP